MKVKVEVQAEAVLTSGFGQKRRRFFSTAAVVY